MQNNRSPSDRAKELDFIIAKMRIAEWGGDSLGPVQKLFVKVRLAYENKEGLTPEAKLATIQNAIREAYHEDSLIKK